MRIETVGKDKRVENYTWTAIKGDGVFGKVIAEQLHRRKGLWPFRRADYRVDLQATIQTVTHPNGIAQHDSMDQTLIKNASFKNGRAAINAAVIEYNQTQQ